MQIYSQMPYGDDLALADFFFAHRLAHLASDASITQQFGVSLPNAVLDNDNAQRQWSALMRVGRGLEKETPPSAALADWLYWHDNLHKSEYAFLRLGDAPDLDSVSFDDPQQFYDWMYLHASVHDALAQATGVT